MSRSPFDEAAAFFDLFVRSDWASCHVRGGGLEMFVARDAGHANPMVARSPDAGEAVAAPVVATATLGAPHVGTLVELAAVGVRIAAGDRYGGIALLDESLDLVADRAGTITGHAATPGALVEFAQPLVRFG